MSDVPAEVTVTVPVDEMTAPVPGSNKRECIECGADCWVSPATQSEIDRGLYPDVILCVPCAMEGSDE